MLLARHEFIILLFHLFKMSLPNALLIASRKRIYDVASGSRVTFERYIRRGRWGKLHTCFQTTTHIRTRLSRLPHQCHTSHTVVAFFCSWTQWLILLRVPSVFSPKPVLFYDWLQIFVMQPYFMFLKNLPATFWLNVLVLHNLLIFVSLIIQPKIVTGCWTSECQILRNQAYSSELYCWQWRHRFL